MHTLFDIFTFRSRNRETFRFKQSRRFGTSILSTSFHLGIERLFSSRNNQPAIPDYGWVLPSRNQEIINLLFQITVGCFHLAIKTVCSICHFADTGWERQGFPSRNQEICFSKLYGLYARAHGLRVSISESRYFCFQVQCQIYPDVSSRADVSISESSSCSVQVGVRNLFYKDIFVLSQIGIKCLSNSTLDI